MSEERPPLSQQGLAAIDLIQRTGAKSFQIRYSDDEEPVVWMAIAEFVRSGSAPESPTHEVAASLRPERAVMRLADQLVDGGICVRCGLTAGVAHDLKAYPLGVCWYQYDPELGKYRRSCE